MAAAVVTEEVKEQLVEASTVTKRAFNTYRREAESEEHLGAAEGPAAVAADKGQEEGEMSVIITIMQPILRLMQLLCENHNRELQVSHYSSGHTSARSHRELFSFFSSSRVWTVASFAHVRTLTPL